MTFALPKLPDLPQPEAPVVPRAEQYQADAGDGIAVANVAAITIAAKSDFIAAPSMTVQWHHPQRFFVCKRP
jgi:hypothetical protein